LETDLKYLALATALAFTACTPAAETPTAPEASTPAATPEATPPAASADALTPTGWSTLKIGMTKAEVVAAVGDKSDPDSSGGPQPELCDEFHPARAPDGLFVMLEEGKLSRITITELSKLKTGDGFGVGDDPAAIKTFYGSRARATPHKYQDKPAEYVTVWDGAAHSEPYVKDETARGFVYEVDGTGKVGAVHAGGPSIQYVEGCL
jgi:hypothetical protein